MTRATAIIEDTSLRFAARIDHALASLRSQFESALTEDRPPPKLSKASLLKQHAISRAQLYKYQYLVTKIEHVFEQLRQRATEVEAAKKKPSISSLQAEVVALRKALKTQAASYASTTITELLERCGPMMRDRQHMMLQYQECLRENERLRQVNANQARTIKDLYAIKKK